ncbi:Glyoxylase, beta-lactamase superfamily II [Asanoa hainanensis]|uniref:Glyoxylase, beta-lactamase superfamily II n=1 Tax=Asanoa hainanensis TaxID=560556 RepID=A0A239PEN4_9ACTN|nr:MBL fold metallo-hydrolase [Asanoa hainanensis]SNT65546.1 Glyoxylase, beta-lactamase superfamily II [Asanoa hainanensis]
MGEVTAINLIDLRLAGKARTTGAYLLDSPDGPTLVDCGASSTLDALRRGLHANDVTVAELRHIVVTHIHLDHAGAAGTLVRENPALQVHVSEVGRFHLAYPVALEFSARGVYGDRFDEFWGPLVGVPESNLHAVGEKVCGLKVVPTPGHAVHHVSYLAPDGTLFAGDAGGIRIAPGKHITPPTPPPDFDLDAWLHSIDAMQALRPTRLALSHFGFADDPDEHLTRLRAKITHWHEVVAGGTSEDEFAAFVRDEVAAGGEQADYHETLPAEQLYRGIKMYVERTRTR